ncbi:metallophosphoesterase [Halobacteriales archaeon QS_5_70_15]|nr:MAG: metallophosphoesterase [Halobacteriales archaeon QS_5_70_15]
MARLERPRTDVATRLAVVADPHLATRERDTSKLFEHTERHLRAAFEDANRRDVDQVVSVGDITKDGEPWNYARFDELLADLDGPFLSVPGNHDVPKAGDNHETIPVAEYAERYAPAEYPFVHRVGGVDLVCLNSSGTEETLYDSHDGLVTEPDVAWLRETLPDLETPVAVTHFNLPTTSDQLRGHRDAVEREMAIPPVLREPEPFVDALATNDVPLMLTGHLHMPTTAVQRGVREVMVPTTCSFPQAYLLVEVGPRGTEIRMVPVADHGGIRYGHAARWADSVTARGLTSMAAVRCAQFPLVDEWDERT